MTSKEIRSTFLGYFQQNGHTVVRGAPVVPADDPTLLFTNAGMNQFKGIFLGGEKRDYVRATSAQKCIRVSGKHNDLEDVGKDTYHHTFFEMLGNWSFGDYYKAEAIAFAWELLTGVYGLPRDQLYATVFEDDDEALRLWPKVAGMPESRVLRFGKKANFWEMGDTGPCGPCSELHMDLGADKGCGRPDCAPNCPCCEEMHLVRFVELWNLVFIQYNRSPDGALEELPAKHVDTGMGLERLVAVLQGKSSNYDTDLFTPIIQAIEDLAERSYADGTLPEQTAFRVIADHVRAMTCAISDGVMPSNEGRGYVIRRILRRGARYGRKLGMHEPFINRLVSAVADVLGDAYPEVTARSAHVALVMKSEEDHFGRTLDRGLDRFEEAVTQVLHNGSGVMDGRDAFLLYDTYGFPLDLTELMAKERGLSVDRDGFEGEMQRQRSRSRKGLKATSAHAVRVAGETHSEFTGYEEASTESEVVSCTEIKDGGLLEIVLSRTPFYPESGGQVGDRGNLTGRDFEVKIEDTTRVGETILHKGRLVSGEIGDINGTVVAMIDTERRRAAARNHTATHLLHSALRTVLGDHVHQAGSLVTPERLRFDFSHFASLTLSERLEIEDLVNDRIVENVAVRICSKTIEEAKALGAIALFGEKYGDSVRVVQIGRHSLELCGGTHIDATGSIGAFRLSEETGIAAGIRRIEAVTAAIARKQAQNDRLLLDEVRHMLDDPPPAEISRRLENLLARLRRIEKTNEELLARLAARDMDDLIAGHAGCIDGVTVVAARVQAGNVEALRLVADALRERLARGVGVLGTVADGSATLLAVVTDNLIKENGLKAGDLVRELAVFMGGGGGGRPHMAQAGGGDPARLDSTLKEVPQIVRRKLSGG